MKSKSPKGFALLFRPHVIDIVAIFSNAEARLLTSVDMGELSNAELRDAATQVSEELPKYGYKAQPVLVGLTANQALYINLPKHDPGSIRFSKTMLEVALEETCPFDAENMLAVQLASEPGKVWVAIRDRIEPFVENLNKLDVHVSSIVPTLPWLMSVFQDDKTVDGQQLLFLNGKPSESVVAENGVLRWFVGTNEDSNENQNSTLVLLDERHGTEGIAESASTVDGYALLANGFFPAVQGKLIDQIPDFGSKLLSKGSSPLSSLTSLVAFSILMLLFAGIFALQDRTHQYKSAVQQVNAQTQRVFESSIPDARKTRLYEKVMSSELTKIRRQLEIFESVVPATLLAEQICEFTKSVPGESEFEVKTIRVAPERIEVTGHVADVTTLDQLKNNLSNSGWMVISGDSVYGNSFRLVCQKTEP